MENLYEIIESVCTQDPFWADAIKKYFDSLVTIDEEMKLQFFKRLIKNHELYGEFTREVVKPIDANELFNKYWQLILQEPSDEEKNDPQKTMETSAAYSNMINDAAILDIPLRSDFTINNTNPDVPQMIMSYANEKGISQMLVSDGKLNEGETFEDRIKKVSSNSKAFAKTFSNKNVDGNFFFYKDFKATFDYRVYVHDLIMDNAEKTKWLRQLVAYFVDPKTQTFYQLTIGVGKFDYPTELLTIGKLDENNPIMKEVIGILDHVMNGITYRVNNEKKI